MAALPGRRITLALAALVLALAAGSAVAGEAPGKTEAAADPPWLLLTGVAVVGTIAAGGLAALWGRKLERAGVRWES